MSQYEYGRIARLAEKLQEAGIAPQVIAQIMAGGDAIGKSASPEKKAEWLGQAMRRMDQLLDPATCHAVREACACCLGGKRLKLSKEIAKQNGTLEERIRAANDARFVFGHSVALQEDGTVLVRFAPEGLAQYRCPCLSSLRAVDISPNLRYSKSSRIRSAQVLRLRENAGEPRFR
jgi:hypothetical protein